MCVLVCECAHVCFRTYNISVFRGLKVLAGARSRVTTYLSHLFVFEAQTRVYVCVCVIICTDVLFVQVCVVIAGASMSDPTRWLLLETPAHAPGTALQR